jgi:MoaA/NifB/PqqE/SkfB family radical SAM enzyme
MTRDNMDEILILAEWVLSEKIVDGHYFNLIRGDARNPILKEITPDRLKTIYMGIASIQERYAERWATGSNRIIRWLKKVAYLGTLTFHHRTQLQNAAQPKAWAMPCTAGETSAVIDFDGRVRSCELRKPIGDLRSHDMNFKVFWESEARRSEPGKIACDQCWCSHVCFIHDSMRYSWRAKLWEVPKNYFLRKVW